MEDKTKKKATIEAILFSMGEAVTPDKIAAALEITEEACIALIKEMQTEYQAENRGIQLIDVDGAYQFGTKIEYYDALSKIVNMPKKHTLTDVLLETLSIVAYKQPITRQEIEAIRGVSCVHAVNKLVEYNLICEVGRLDAVGRPILFGTTEDFLRSFGVTSTDDLPIITPDKIADFKQEALEEVQLTIDT